MFVAGAVAIGVALAACSDDPDDATTTTSASTDDHRQHWHHGRAGDHRSTGVDRHADTSAPDASAPAGTALPAEIQAIMDQPRYADATWSLLVTDVETGETFYALNADRMSFTGSTRKLFSVGLALDTLGADHRIDDARLPPRRGRRRRHARRATSPSSAPVTSCSAVGASTPTPSRSRRSTTTTPTGSAPRSSARRTRCTRSTTWPREVRAAGHHVGRRRRRRRPPPVRAVPRAQRQPADHAGTAQREHGRRRRVTPTEAGQPATVTYRPETAAFAVDGRVTTGAAGTDATVELSDDRLIECLGERRMPRHGVGRRSRSATRRRCPGSRRSSGRSASRTPTPSCARRSSRRSAATA